MSSPKMHTNKNLQRGTLLCLAHFTVMLLNKIHQCTQLPSDI